VSDNNADDLTKQVPGRDLKVDPTAEDLLESAAMKPYMNLAMAMMGGKNAGPAIEELAVLPLEKRYVWRCVRAQVGLCRLRYGYRRSGRQTISPEDRKQLADQLQQRPLQFCLFLSTLFGQKQMELLILSAIKNSRGLAQRTEGDGPTMAWYRAILG
jgi:hypothetical protein